MLREKTQETLQYIQQLTQEETAAFQKDMVENSDITEQGLEAIVTKIEEKIGTPTEEIEKEQEPKIQKRKKQERCQWKKTLKLIPENFLPPLAKYKEQNEIFGDRNSCSKTDKDATLCV